ncbi:NAD-dependent epimerase/dehydratase family protein [Candidatus Pseudothioglobus singularis]|nr:NAD-dependent epimerase/dehydratase family protein [Candidatus Pseudothioglobus singularis]
MINQFHINGTMTDTISKVPRILIVGGTGFIGSHIVNKAIELGWEVTSLGFSTPDNRAKNWKKLSYVSADISNLTALRSALLETSFEYVVNCAGYIDHSPFSTEGRLVLDTHFIGVLNLVEIIDKSSLKAFINIGSSDEYGNLIPPQKETSREEPISPYSMAKVAATQFLQMLWRTENFPATTLRLFLTYGPGQDHNRFLPQIINGCLKGKSFPVSTGEQLRDFCYIDDTIEAVFLTLQNKKTRGEVINIASGHPVSIHNVINNVKTLAGKGNPIFGELEYRIGENMELYADISKSNSILGWAPKITLNQGLIKTIRWYSEKV